MIRIAIMDDHPVARWGMAQILVETGEVELVASAASPQELLGILERLAGDTGAAFPDIVVLDLYHDDDKPCLDTITQLSANTRVLVMSVSGRPEDVLGAIRAGAAGYLTKHASPEMFVSAARTIAAGGFALSAQLADILRTGLTGQAEQTRCAGDTTRPVARTVTRPTTTLSAREEETLKLIARGFTHAQAATRMGVSKATVDTYIERVRAKLQVGNKAELTRVALTRLRQASLP